MDETEETESSDGHDKIEYQKPLIIEYEDGKGNQGTIIVPSTNKYYKDLDAAYSELNKLENSTDFFMLKYKLTPTQHQNILFLKDQISLENLEDESFMKGLLTPEIFEVYKNMKDKHPKQYLKDYLVLKSVLNPEQFREYLDYADSIHAQDQSISLLNLKAKAIDHVKKQLEPLEKAIAIKNSIKYKYFAKAPKDVEERKSFKLEYCDKNGVSRSVYVMPTNKAYKRLHQAHNYLSNLNKLKLNKENLTLTNEIIPEKLKHTKTYINVLAKLIIEKDMPKDKKRNTLVEQAIEPITIHVSYEDEKYIPRSITLSKNYKNLVKSYRKFAKQGILNKVESLTINLKDENGDIRSIAVSENKSKSFAKTCERFAKQEKLNNTEALVLKAKDEYGFSLPVIALPGDKKYKEIVENQKIVAKKVIKLTELETKYIEARKQGKLGKIENLIAKAKISQLQGQIKSANDRIINYTKSIAKKNGLELAK